jgi:hypothetical protein
MLQVRGAGAEAAEHRIYALCREGYGVARCKLYSHGFLLPFFSWFY